MVSTRTPNAIQLEILARLAEGKSLCFSRDGKTAWLSGRQYLPAEYMPHLQPMLDAKWLTYAEDEDSRLDPYIWVITPIGQVVVGSKDTGGE